MFQVSPVEWPNDWISALYLAVALGWLGRLTDSLVPSIGLLAVVVTPSLASIVAFSDWHKSYLKTALVIALGVGEGLWSTETASKTPLIALILALVMWAARILPKRPRSLVYLVLAVGVVGVFVVLQPIKGAYTSSSAQFSEHFSGRVGDVTLTVLHRTDLVTAITDATSTPRPRDYRLQAYASRLVGGLLPDQALTGRAVNAGQVWTMEMRAPSNPKQFLGVSLAEGPIAEGYVVGGVAGAIILSGFLMFLTILSASGLTVGPLWIRGLCAMIVFGSTLFERGLLGFAEMAGKGLQYSCLLAILLLVVRTVHNPARAVMFLSVQRSGTDSRLLNPPDNRVMQ
jgi:hypothetical protein